MERENVHPKNRQEWRDWLSRNHTRKESIWLVLSRKDSGIPGISYAEAVEEALCFGWIDGTANKGDESTFKLTLAPRKKSSGWSKVNKERIDRMMREGRMTAAGLAAIEAAKKDGSWARLDAIEAGEVPDDVQQAFRANPAAKANFDSFPPSTRKAILQWVINAKRPETRAKRIEETVSLAAENKRANEWKPKK